MGSSLCISLVAISPYATMHDEVCDMAIRRQAFLIITHFHRRLGRTGMIESFQPGIKMMNDGIIEMAPCSLAIVIDRAPSATFSPTWGHALPISSWGALMSQMVRKQRVQYVEEGVENGAGTVAVVRSIEDHYDLKIVGRYHPKSLLMLGLSDWEGGSELGAVGNMFALADSNNHSTIVVVQQHNVLFT
ncbi:UNVERIFIED_CONTAM: Cation/H(+) antiporter 15 [Sesamum calycinum]|uniref:Cation/H(+) antiporter 15 n=1 Tax=Sesamum calycinum TaxID=2727403 RepID=A0AAW2MM12_9LAMI